MWGWWVVAGGPAWGPLVTRGEDNPERVPLGGGWRGPSGWCVVAGGGRTPRVRLGARMPRG